MSKLDDFGDFLDRVRQSRDVPATQTEAQAVKADFDALRQQTQDVAQKIEMNIQRALLQHEDDRH